MYWFETYLSTVLSLVVSCAGFMGAYYRLNYRVRAEATVRLRLKEDLERQIEALRQEAAKHSVQAEKPGIQWSWDTRADVNADGRSDWLQMGEIAESCGLEWGGRWKRMPDLPHVQNTYGLTLAEIKEIYRAGGIKAATLRFTRRFSLGGSVFR